ncbi:MAG: hypothetical protein M3Y27_13465 [Acidobacteriota bacterium]|nr:hypothetical protein [Acidobacteriota bacterium]
MAIGYILLIPSVLGILGSGSLFLVSTSATASASHQVDRRTRQEAIGIMRNAGVPHQIINEVLSGERQSPQAWLNQVADQEGSADDRIQTAALTNAVHQAETELEGASTGSGLLGEFVGGFFLIMGVISFVGGLLGWLLVMRKRVLQSALAGQ